MSHPIGGRHWLLPALQPSLHGLNLGSLTGGDRVGERVQLGAIGPAGHQLGGVDRLLVMRDHGL
jgi:hypothetical protein